MSPSSSVGWQAAIFLCRRLRLQFRPTEDPINEPHHGARRHYRVFTLMGSDKSQITVYLRRVKIKKLETVWIATAAQVDTPRSTKLFHLTWDDKLTRIIGAKQYPTPSDPGNFPEDWTKWGETIYEYMYTQ